eukprot:GHVL01010967.1.p1 GENE.GHVL01010967.1~~GHVL01010967.1.p1  ORF type:complete len:522 (+),score=63.88 GHVL01010967.1:1034-2599(+)
MKACSYGGSATAISVLPTMIHIGTKMKLEAFKEKFLPTLKKLFQCTDRGTRISLLQQMETINPLLDCKVVNNDLFDLILVGFSDSNIQVKEATLRAMPFLCPHLNSNNLTKALNVMHRLTGDAEPSLRVNTCICFAKLAPHLPLDKIRPVLIAAITTATKDPFIPCRNAALQSMCICASLFEFEKLTTKIIPMASLLLYDPELEVRYVALSAMKSLISHVEKEINSSDLATTSATAGQMSSVSTVPVTSISIDSLKTWSYWATSKANTILTMTASGSGQVLHTGNNDVQAGNRNNTGIDYVPPHLVASDAQSTFREAATSSVTADNMSFNSRVLGETSNSSQHRRGELASSLDSEDTWADAIESHQSAEGKKSNSLVDFDLLDCAVSSSLSCENNFPTVRPSITNCSREQFPSIQINTGKQNLESSVQSMAIAETTQSSRFDALDDIYCASSSTNSKAGGGGMKLNSADKSPYTIPSNQGFIHISESTKTKTGRLESCSTKPSSHNSNSTKDIDFFKQFGV